MDQVCRLFSATCSLQKANKTNTVQVSVQLRRMFFLLIGYILGANLYTWSFQIAISWISPAKYRTPIQHKGSWHVCLVSRNRKANAALPSLVSFRRVKQRKDIENPHRSQQWPQDQRTTRRSACPPWLSRSLQSSHSRPGMWQRSHWQDEGWNCRRKESTASSASLSVPGPRRFPWDNRPAPA
jgi:hypothetical protein